VAVGIEIAVLEVVEHEHTADVGQRAVQHVAQPVSEGCLAGSASEWPDLRVTLYLL
jgi:hypothetical protein